MLFRIVLIVFLLLAFFIWLRMRAATRRRQGQTQQQSGLNMLACSHCGVHVPENEALVDQGGRFFCCASHRAKAGEAADGS